MVWQRESNGLATQIEWFGNVHRMVLQLGSNDFVTWIEWFANADRMHWQRGSNGLATRIEWRHGITRFKLSANLLPVTYPRPLTQKLRLGTPACVLCYIWRILQA